MTTELKIPDVGESIQEVQIGQWLKKKGDRVQQDENIVELETDKSSMDLPAPATGTLSEILKQNGETVSVGEAIAYIEEGDEPTTSSRDDEETDDEETDDEETDNEHRSTPAAGEDKDDRDSSARAAEQAGSSHAEPKSNSNQEKNGGEGNGQKTGRPSDLPVPAVTPSARRALREHNLTAEDIQPRGKRIRRRDVERFVAEREASESAAADRHDGPEEDTVSRSAPVKDNSDLDRDREELVPVSLIRRRIAERLVAAQQKAALLTTFNEVDMSHVLQFRQCYQERFQKHYGVKLGLMSFFVKAAVDALKQFPELNAEFQETNILYRNYYHIGIAIGSGKGLVVPVLRYAETMSFAEIEKAIDDFVKRAGQNKIDPGDLEGGTFTISNGGIYGSLLSTPIVNPPQSGVLGMHAIEERPVVRDGQVVVRSMMYVALTYDHRIVDGAQAVTFLKRIKEAVEDPARMLVEI